MSRLDKIKTISVFTPLGVRWVSMRGEDEDFLFARLREAEKIIKHEGCACKVCTKNCKCPSHKWLASLEGK